MGRIVSIRHRVKWTAEGESRPTLVAIVEDGNTQTLELEDEQAELDFVFGKFPTAWRAAEDGEDLSVFAKHHIKERKKKGTDEKEVRVPAEYDGFKPGDSAVMILGGSGDRLAFTLSRVGEKIGAQVFRIPGFKLAAIRGEVSKDDDHLTIARAFAESAEFFYEFGPADRDNIAVSELHRARREAQQARIACEQRLRQRLIGKIFLSEEGGYPEGTIADWFDGEKANDQVLQNLIKEEKKREAELKKAVWKLPIWREFFAGVEGCGEVIAAGIITPIADIRQFSTKAKLKAFCGAHVMKDGRFPRRRGGEVANWNPRARQALYLLGSQFVYRPDSEWGVKLREYKVKLREKYPEPVIGGNGKKKYTDGHIHKMAYWRTLTKFVEKLFKEWKRLDAAEKEKEKAA